MIWCVDRVEYNCGPNGPIHIGDMAATDDLTPIQLIAQQAERIRELEALVAVLQTGKAALARVNADSLSRITSLRRRISQLQRQIYGPKSEPHHADQAVVNDLMRGGKNPEPSSSREDRAAADAANSANDADGSAAQLAAATQPDPSADGAGAADAPGADGAAIGATGPAAAATAKPPRRKPGGRMHLPEWMALTDEIIAVPESERIGPNGKPLPWIDDEVAWRLDYIPPHFERVRIIRRIYGTPFIDDLRIIAPPFQAIVAGGLPTDRLVAQVVADKFDMHLPLYRQEGHLDRLGLPVSRATLVNWCAQAAIALAPIHQAVSSAVLTQPVIGLDDTYLPVLVPGKGRCHQGRLWGYLAGEDFFCEYKPTREGRWPAEFLAGYRGTVLGDAYSGHHALFVTGERTPAGCILHARRKFDDAVKLGELRSKRTMDHFSALYEVERRVADRPPGDKLAARQAHSVSIMDKMKVLLEGFLATELPSSATWIAANYTLKIYPQLRQFTEDGRVPIDNNALERCWRGVGIGRRNWLFAGSADGGVWAATLISLSQCCRLVGLDFSTYLRGVFAALHQGRTDYDNLRPSAWARQAQHKVG